MSLDINRADLTVGVVGTGAMGRGIAQVTAQGGMTAIMYDAAPGGAAKAKAAILETLKGLVAKGRLTDADLAKTDANLGVAEKIEDLKGCHVVVEAVFENLEVKQKLFGELEAVIAPDAILASNTSSIRIASIARSLKHRDRVCGMHYFNPVPLMKLGRGHPRRRHRAVGGRRHGGTGQAPDPRSRGRGRHAGLPGQSRRHRDQAPKACASCRRAGRRRRRSTP